MFPSILWLQITKIGFLALVDALILRARACNNDARADDFVEITI